MKHKLLTFAGALALLATLGHFYAKPLLAQVRAALVSNVDDPGRIPYQTQQILCSTSFASCSVTLAPVLPGKRLVITNVSGSVDTSQPSGYLVQPSLGGSPETLLTTTFQGSFAGLNSFVFNQTVLRFYDAGEAPIVSVDLGVNSPSAARFFLRGYLLDCMTAPCAAIQP